MEHIIANITLAILNGEKPDIEALEVYLGSYELADAIVEGIQRGVDTFKGTLNLEDYE